MDGTYSQVLAAGIEALFPGGRHFNLLETSTAVDLIFYGQNNQIIAKADQVQAGLEYSPKDEKGRPIRFINIGITSALAQTVKIYVTDGDFVYRRSIGDVDAKIYGGGLYQDLSDIGLLKQRDISHYYDVQNSKDEFIGMSYRAGGSDYTSLFYNPAASGILAVITRLDTSGSNKNFYFKDVGALPDGTLLVNSTNKYLGEAAPLCEIRTLDGVVAGTTQLTNMLQLTDELIGANDKALIIPAGFEIMITAGAATYMMIHWKEI